MKMSTCSQIRAIALITCLACVASVHAMTITLNGEIVFHDDFEAGTVGEAFGPVDGPARWSFNFRGSDARVEVHDSLSVGPGAAEGNQYGHLSRGASVQTVARSANLPPIAVGDELHAELMVYIPSGQPSFAFYLAFADTNDTHGASIGVYETGDVVTYNYDIHGWDLSGLSFQYDTWQKWEQDWIVGSSEKKISINGNSVTVGGADSGGNPISTIYLGTVPGSNYFVDAVPVSASALSVPEPLSAIPALTAIAMAMFRVRTASRRRC